MISSFSSFNLFNSKVHQDDAAASVEEEQQQVTSLGLVEQTRITLGMEKKLFSHTGHSIQIIAALTGTSYLKAHSNGNDTVVLKDGTGNHVAIVKRIDNEFIIYSYGTSGQLPLARVMQARRALNVTMEGEADPTYTVHKVISHPSLTFPTKHTIKKHGRTVASTRYGKETHTCSRSILVLM